MSFSPMRLDTLIRVETPEGISLTLRPAGVVSRLYAFSIDVVIRMIIMIIGSIVIGWMGHAGAGLYLLLYFAIEWFYPVVFELMPGAATPGKRVMDLRVVMDNGLPVTPAASFTRNLLRVVDFIPFGYVLGLLSMLARHDFKRVGDLAAGTLVVHDAVVKLHGAPEEVAATPPARALTGGEQAAVVAWALRTPRLTPARAEELACLAEPVLPRNGIERSPAERLLGVAHWIMGKRRSGGRA